VDLPGLWWGTFPVAAMGHCEYKYTVKYLKMIDPQKRKQFLDFSIQQKEKR
jgi:hypothetical protein